MSLPIASCAAACTRLHPKSSNRYPEFTKLYQAIKQQQTAKNHKKA
jgi:hypothetical protein